MRQILDLTPSIANLQKWGSPADIGDVSIIAHPPVLALRLAVQAQADAVENTWASFGLVARP